MLAWADASGESHVVGPPPPEPPPLAEQLRALYPTHGAYVAKVARSATRLAVDRFLTAPDAVGLIREAAHAPVP